MWHWLLKIASVPGSNPIPSEWSSWGQWRRHQEAAPQQLPVVNMTRFIRMNGALLNLKRCAISSTIRLADRHPIFRINKTIHFTSLRLKFAMINHNVEINKKSRIIFLIKAYMYTLLIKELISISITIWGIENHF